MTTRSGRGQIRLVALAAAFVLAVGLPVAAQDADESPAAEQSEVELAPEDGIAFPVMLVGQLLTENDREIENWRSRVQAALGSNGKVASARLGDSELPNEVGQCMVKAVKRWTFPKPRGGGVVSVVYPIVLEPG